MRSYLTKIWVLVSQRSVLAYVVIFFAVFSCLGCESETPVAADADAAQPEPAAADAEIVEPALRVSGTPAEAEHNEAEPTAGADEIKVAVTVNGVAITEADVDVQVKPQLEKMAAQASQLPPSFLERYERELRQQVLEKMIVERLLVEKVKASNIVVTEEEVIGRIKEMASQQQPPLSLEDFKALIEAYGQNFDETKQYIRRALTYQKLMEAQWAGKINVTADDAKKYYSENAPQLEEIRASHILIKSDTADPDTDPNETEAKAEAKAQDLLKQIKAGADFAELAKANSACPSAAKGGDLGFFARGRMVPAFEKAAFELKVGQVSDIVKTRFGYHIIKLTDRKDTFEQFKDEILKTLLQKRRSEFAMRYIELLKAGANIIYPPGKEPAARATGTQTTTGPPVKETPADSNAVTESEGKAVVE